MAVRKRLIQKVDFVDPRGYEYFDVDIDVLIPDPENPRIPPQEMVTLETMLALFRKNPNGIYKLAKDLAELGTNPAELLNVTRLSDALFLVKEGNRRLTAQKLLRNPEQLKGHVTSAELRRWHDLAKAVTPQLSFRQLVVVGESHDPWIVRRHQGSLEGVGVEPWGPEAKARHAEKKLGKRNRAMALREALRASYPDRFRDIPERSYSVFERFIESADSSAHLGLDVDEAGRLKLLRGERSLRLLEEVVNDFRRQRGDPHRLTTRTINTVQGAQDYLRKLDQRIDGEALSEREVILQSAPTTVETKKTSGATASSGGKKKRQQDVLKRFKPPTAARLQLIFDELVKARRLGHANAAMVLTRVLLELSVDEYSDRVGVNFEAADPEIKQEIQGLRRFLGQNNYPVPKKLSQALDRAKSLPLTLAEKLAAVLAQLEATGKMKSREVAAKRRELHDKEVLNVLNDAVHRLENFPSISRVDHVLEVVRPIFDGMNS